jgi:hypothetical protein
VNAVSVVNLMWQYIFSCQILIHRDNQKLYQIIHPSGTINNLCERNNQRTASPVTSPIFNCLNSIIGNSVVARLQCKGNELILIRLTKTNLTLRDFKLSPQCKWDLHCLETLRSLNWLLPINTAGVLAQPTGPTFKGEAVHKENNPKFNIPLQSRTHGLAAGL